MAKSSQSRRDFLFTAMAGLAAAPLVYSCSGSTEARSSTLFSKLAILRKNANQDPDCEWCGARDVPDNVTWKARMYREGDPGEQLIIDGTVYKPDGNTPANDTLLYIYHTDNEGYYGRKGEPRHGKYRGWMLTGEDGKYSFWTIRPAPYPNRRSAAHIHMTVTGLDRKENWVDSIKFVGDPLLKPHEISKERGGFPNVIPLKKDRDGIWRGTRNLILPKI